MSEDSEIVETVGSDDQRRSRVPATRMRGMPPMRVIMGKTFGKSHRVRVWQGIKKHASAEYKAARAASKVKHATISNLAKQHAKASAKAESLLEAAAKAKAEAEACALQLAQLEKEFDADEDAHGCLP